MSSRQTDLTNEVRKFENLNAPIPEYSFASRRFMREAHHNPVTAPDSTARPLVSIPPSVTLADYESEVRKFENLNTPNLEYRFSNKNYYRDVGSVSGIYGPIAVTDFLFQDGSEYTFQDKENFLFNIR